jgi:RP/EB family microtubule-associated protein
MQDNLEFLQWMKKFWDLNFPGEYYDAAARRGAGNEPLSSGNANRSTTAPNKRVTSAGTFFFHFKSIFEVAAAKTTDTG